MMAMEREPASWLTVAEFGHRVGMSARSIRAYQARRLLPPPVRSSRTVYYHEGHVRRLETIRSLQRQGYNLASIAAILGRDQAADELGERLDWLLARQPRLVRALLLHGIVVRTDDGRLLPARPKVLSAALALAQSGVQPGQALRLLCAVADQMTPVADDLFRAVSTQVLSCCAADGEGPVALAERVAAMLAEAFRIALENRGHAWTLNRAASDGHRGYRPAAYPAWDPPDMPADPPD
jgi:DNA-binding transcriptional MerR regulator